MTCEEWSGAHGEAFFGNAPVVGAVTLALQALPFPLHLRPYLLPPWLLWKLSALCLSLVHPPLPQSGIATWGSQRVSLSWTPLRSLLPPPDIRCGWGGGGGCCDGLDFWGHEWLGYFFPSGEWCSRILSLSVVTCARCPFLGSLLCLCWTWSSIALLRGWGFYRGPLPLSLFTAFSLARSTFLWRASLCSFTV